MKFTLTQASNGSREEIIEINSLEELNSLIHYNGDIVIINLNDCRYNYPNILIYDDYVE